MTFICVSNLTIIGPDNGLSPGRRQAIIWTNAGILLIGPWVTNFSEIIIGIHTFSFKKIHLKMLSVKWWPFCPGLNVLTHWPQWDVINNSKQVILKYIWDYTMNCSCEIAIRYMYPVYESALVKAILMIFWQPTSHHLSQCWPSSKMPHSITSRQLIECVYALHNHNWPVTYWIYNRASKNILMWNTKHMHPKA